jgi:hypothetical protein
MATRSTKKKVSMGKKLQYVGEEPAEKDDDIVEETFADKGDMDEEDGIRVQSDEKPRLRQDDDRYITGTRVRRAALKTEKEESDDQDSGEERHSLVGKESAEKEDEQVDAEKKSMVKKKDDEPVEFVGDHSKKLVQKIQDDEKGKDVDEGGADAEEKSFAPRSFRPPTVGTSEVGVSNILVEYDDELPTVIEEIEGVRTKKVVVSIPEGSDLLVSSVSMRLIARHADKQGKMVAVVTDDPAGRNMARLAGLGVADSTASVDDRTWSDVQTARESREEAASERMMKKEVGVEEPLPMDSGVLVNKDFHDNIDETTGVREKMRGQVLPRTRGDTSTEGEREPVTSMKGELSPALERKDVAVPFVGAPEAEKGFRTVSVGDFELTIDEGRKNMGTSQPRSSQGQAGQGGRSHGGVGGLVGRDFSDVGGIGAGELRSYDTLPVESNMGSTATVSARGKGSFVKTVGATIAGVFAKIPQSGVKIAGGAGKKTLRKVMIPVLIVLGLVLLGGYWYLPEVIVELEVESISVEYTGDITALARAEQTDAEELIIPARMEIVEKTGSDSASATGTAVRGEKAGGAALFFNKTGAIITIADGSTITNGGLNFVVQGAVTVPACVDPPDCIGMGSAAGDVVAEAVGADYNLASGTIFSVQDHDAATLFAKNSSAFTGGTETSYQVVSQSDIDGVADRLRTQLYDQAKLTLTEKLDGTKWVFVESSIKNELDGEVTSDVPAGSEEPTVNVDVKTKSTAVYYDGKALTTLITDLLLQDLSEEELQNVELSDDLDETVTVKSASVDDGNAVLTVDVSGFVMPVLDERAVERDLYGKPWAEGIAYLKKLDYVTGEPTVDFFPQWFPGFLRRMPGRSGRITVNVKNVVPEETNDETGGGNGDTSN